MKNRILICLMALLAFYACNEGNDLVEKIEVVNEDQPILKSLHPPGFEINWESQRKIKITTVKDSVDLPWAKDCPTSIPLEIRTDIKKEHGWVFLSTESRQTGTDYLLFYNRYTGLLRVFYYNVGGVLTNNAVWEFFDENSYGYFNQGLTFTTPLSSVRIQRVGVNALSQNSTLGIDRGWNCFQVPITYTGKNGRINIYSKMLNISSLQLTGNYTETTTGTIIEDHYGTKENTIQKGAKSAIKATGKAADNWVKEEAEKSIKSPKNGIFKNIGSVLSGLAGKGSSELVTSGLNALFGSFLGTNANAPTIQTVELTTNGQIELNGSMTANLTGNVLPLTGINFADGLGVWNLRDNPKVKTSVIHTAMPLATDNPYGKRYALQYYEIIYTPFYEVVINPNILKDVTYTVKHQFVEFTTPGGSTIAGTKIGGYAVDTYIYCNNALGVPRPELNIDSSKSSILLGSQARIGVAVYSTDNIINPTHQDYIRHFGVYSNAYSAYSRWIINPSKKYIEGYLPKEMLGRWVKQYVSPGDLGVNITVTIKVKSTGQEIVSSRTYFPDYELLDVR